MTHRFQVLILAEAEEFLSTLEQSAREKVIYNLRKARSTNDSELFKKLKDNIWEFRTLYNKTQYRLLAFWDKQDKQNTLVICTHGVIKKTSKIPPKEILKAVEAMNNYFDNKE